MAPGVEIVERIEDDGKGFEPIYIELGVFDVGVVGFEFDVRVELLGDIFRYL